uniref:Uncharacterized protein n=1 Tax=Avena sativa TaxID=4498 RepID=A0ACD5VKS3_AVESA
MADVVGSVTKIVEVALKIKDAVDTVRQNKEVCIQIRKRVSRLSAILLHLNMEKLENMKEPAMRETLLELEGALLRALSLVTSCREKNSMSLAFTSGKLSKQLYQVKQDISDHMMEVILATNVQVTVMITRHYQEGVHPSPQSEGSEVNHEKVNTLNGGTSNWAPDSVSEDEATPPNNALKSESTAKKISESVDIPNCNWKSEATANCFTETVDIPNYFLKSEATPNCFSGSVDTPNHFLKNEDTPIYNFESEASSNSGWSAPARKKTDPLLSRFMYFCFPELEAATNNFSKEHVIGEGGCATVYKGVLPDGLMVAIKRFRDPWGPQSVMQYSGVFSTLFPHKNIVKFLGYCHENRREMVVEEYMPKGNLSRVINGSLHKLDWSSTFRIIREIAEGVAYLHTKNIIHMDLKPDNILFDADMNPKICDFGSSVKLDQAVTQTVTDELVGTMGFIPMEYLADGIISLKYDVYSFGVLLLCTISGLGQNPTDIREIATPKYCHDSINWVCIVHMHAS